MIGGNYFTVTVNNASAAVLAKAVITMGPTILTAGSLQISDTIVYAISPTANAITQSAGSVLTLNNSQTLNSTLTGVSRNSFGGFYSILHSVYDRSNTSFTGTSLNAIDYSQYINADSLTINGGGFITGANLISTNIITANIWNGLYTANVVESTSNLYYTNARVYSNVLALLPTLAGDNILIAANGRISANAAGITAGLSGSISTLTGNISILGNLSVRDKITTNSISI